MIKQLRFNDSEASKTPLLSFLEASEPRGSSHDMRGQNIILGSIKMPSLAQLS
jgi:hypothetical protein